MYLAPMSKRVCIVGGGVIGLCCAYYLQKDGFDITVIDKGNITNGTSFGNAGYISPSHFIPLASPGIVAKGLRWMLSSASPFYIKPRLDWNLLRWGVAFWRKANASTVKRNAPHLNAILQLSRQLTSSLKDDIGNKFRMEEKGCLMLYKTAVTEKYELQLAKEANSFGIDSRILSATEIQKMEPDVEVKVRGGVLYPIDCHLHPGDFMQTLKDHLSAKGVKFRLNANVRSFETRGKRILAVLTTEEKLEHDEYILAGGSWLPILTKHLGINILLQAGKGYSLTYPGIKKNLHYPAILVDDRVAMTPMGKDLRIGGTMEISGFNTDILLKRVESIFNAAKNYYPGLEVDFPDKQNIWSGLRPLTPDGLPYIGRHRKYENLTVAGGHAMLGLSLAAGTGNLVGEIIKGVKPSIDMSAFNVERFD